MKLIETFDQEKVQFKEIPMRMGNPSGYLVIALIQDGSEIYVAFTDHNQEGLWIERYIAPSIQRGFFCFEDLAWIEDEEEFKTIRNFLIQKKLI